MLSVALMYRSCEGQTVKILKEIDGQLQEMGCKTTWFDLASEARQVDWDIFDAFLLGCSIRYGRHHKDFCQFVEANRQQLNSKPSYFFSVNLTARKPERCRPDNNRYLQKYLASTQWTPTQVDVFAGALLYSKYNWFNKRIIQFIMKLTGGSTDTSRDIELTDWNRVAEFGTAVSRSLRQLDNQLPDNASVAS